MELSVKYTVEGQAAINEIRKLCKLEVCAGFQAGTSEVDGAQVVDVAYFNHFGTHTPDGSVYIPARPFMDAIKNHKTEFDAFTVSVLQQMITGSIDSQTALDKIGSHAKSLIQMEIRDGSWAPNSGITVNGGWITNPWCGKPVHIEGKGSTKPLIGTGHMRQSVTYVLREDGE